MRSRRACSASSLLENVRAMGWHRGAIPEHLRQVVRALSVCMVPAAVLVFVARDGGGDGSAADGARFRAYGRVGGVLGKLRPSAVVVSVANGNESCGLVHPRELLAPATPAQSKATWSRRQPVVPRLARAPAADRLHPSPLPCRLATFNSSNNRAQNAVLKIRQEDGERRRVTNDLLRRAPAETPRNLARELETRSKVLGARVETSNAAIGRGRCTRCRATARPADELDGLALCHVDSPGPRR